MGISAKFSNKKLGKLTKWENFDEKTGEIDKNGKIPRIKRMKLRKMGILDFKSLRNFSR